MLQRFKEKPCLRLRAVSNEYSFSGCKRISVYAHRLLQCEANASALQQQDRSVQGARSAGGFIGLGHVFWYSLLRRDQTLLLSQADSNRHK
jgi:hypothetical protein